MPCLFQGLLLVEKKQKYIYSWQDVIRVDASIMTLFSSQYPTVAQIAEADLKHVLILQLDDSSAIVMLSPALRALREALPEAKLTLMTSAAGSQMAPLLPWVD